MYDIHSETKAGKWTHRLPRVHTPSHDSFCTLPAFLAPFATADTDCQLTFGDGRGFPYQWQDMMGQMKINGTPGVNEVIVASSGKRRRLFGGLVRLMNAGEGESERRLL